MDADLGRGGFCLSRGVLKTICLSPSYGSLLSVYKQ